MDALERFGHGDRKTLELLMEECWSPLVLYLATILGSRDSAQDIAQEAFVRIWERRGGWPPGPARGLLFRIGRNLALDALDRDEVRSRWAGRQRLESLPSPPTPEQELERSESVDRIREALDTLPLRRREVVDLVRLRGLSHAEVGEVLGISVQTVANHLSLAFRDLRSLLARHQADHDREERAPTLERSSDG